MKTPMQHAPLSYQLALCHRACDKHLVAGLVFACLAVPCVLALPGRGAALGAIVFLALTARSVSAWVSGTRRGMALRQQIRAQHISRQAQESRAIYAQMQSHPPAPKHAPKYLQDYLQEKTHAL